jgi:hypothetical protein
VIARCWDLTGSGAALPWRAQRLARKPVDVHATVFRLLVRCLLGFAQAMPDSAKWQTASDLGRQVRP